MKPLVSVIIPTKNEEKNLKKCLESVSGQDYPCDRMEVIVVDNFSDDRTKEIALGYTPIVFEKGPERSVQRNYGLEKCAGKYFLFLDADMSLSSHAISECVDRMERDTNLVALYIPEIINGNGFWGKVRNFERSFYNETVIDGLRFIRTEAMRSIGGFDENLYAAEDWDLDKRLKPLGRTGIIRSPLYHNESGFTLRNYLKKKAFYADNFGLYIDKWGKDDPEIKKQFGFGYRFFGVFLERGKWKKFIRRFHLAVGMYFMKAMVGFIFLFRKKRYARKT